MEINKRSECPISFGLDIFGDKWSLLIIRDIMFWEKNTYGAFINSGEKIATNILADRLVKLENAGIIEKQEHPESRAKHFYKLTKKGIDLMPILMEIIVWSDKYTEVPREAKLFSKLVKKNRQDLIKKISLGLLAHLQKPSKLSK